MIVDADTVLSGAIPAKGFQLIARRHLQVLQPDGGIQNSEFLERPSAEIGRKTAAFAELPEPLRFQRVFADQDFTQAAGDGVAIGRVDNCFDDLRGGVCLADALEPIIGSHAHQHDILTTGSLLLDRFDAQDLADDLGYFHGPNAFRNMAMLLGTATSGSSLPSISSDT